MVRPSSIFSAFSRSAAKGKYDEAFVQTPSTGYETLLFDALTGDQTLFHRADSTEVSEMRNENAELKAVVAELTLRNRFLKKLSKGME